jgi:uncharacterized HAD superfamily protein
MKSKAIIVDIDGTLAKMNGRSPFAWDRVGEDKVNEAVRKLINIYFLSGSGLVIIFSGRDSVCRDITVKWLEDNKINYDMLHMRPEGNNEKDSIIKRRMYDEYIADRYDIEFVVDDRDQVVEMWRKDLGLTCFQVDYGNF